MLWRHIGLTDFDREFRAKYIYFGVIPIQAHAVQYKDSFNPFVKCDRPHGGSPRKNSYEKTDITTTLTSVTTSV